jgi:hypothetical protein
MVAADSRFDYLSSTYRPRGNELHGVLEPRYLKRNLSLKSSGRFFVIVAMLPQVISN